MLIVQSLNEFAYPSTDYTPSTNYDEYGTGDHVRIFENPNSLVQVNLDSFSRIGSIKEILANQRRPGIGRTKTLHQPGSNGSFPIIFRTFDFALEKTGFGQVQPFSLVRWLQLAG